MIQSERDDRNRLRKEVTDLRVNGFCSAFGFEIDLIATAAVVEVVPHFHPTIVRTPSEG